MSTTNHPAHTLFACAAVAALAATVYGAGQSGPAAAPPAAAPVAVELMSFLSGPAERPMLPTELHGDPDEASNYWNQQNFQDCGLMAVATVVGLTTGTAPSEQEIVAVASSLPSPGENRPIYTPPDPNNPNSDNGTTSEEQIVLLKHYGINATATDDGLAAETGLPTGIPALPGYLDSGRRLIVGVNAETIWAEEGGYDADDHSVVLTGVDPEAGVVFLSDSGTEDGDGEQVPIDVFERAWAVGGHDLIVAG
ncbi:hypothetical protein JRC04_04145 [Mycolicibacterium sp. S2-37]|uniref:hypothetical protein n=1 Tax=Mycolicibacterium sp. S2-37 TaxID=2810297 RepID=UPI001A93D4DC|nr:hypothetical protein [Mycolicibacterium sp. S2-37]MBO0676654.1 hypothetical protein [Mycolicibacterium sp. S2-37]